MEKAGSDRGWIALVPQEEWSYGYHPQLDHFVHAFLAGRPSIPMIM